MSEFGHEERVVAPFFDAQFYKDSYPDLAGRVSDFLIHYMQVGWQEGRNPSLAFDTVGYLVNNPDVAAFGMNPFYHYHQHGKGEGRQASPGYSPVDRLALLGVSVAVDWVERLKPEVDIDHYRRVAGLVDNQQVDPVAHFAFHGWRRGHDPNPSTETAGMIVRHAEASNLLVNPVLAELLELSGDWVPESKIDGVTLEFEEAEGLPFDDEPEFEDDHVIPDDDDIVTDEVDDVPAPAPEIDNGHVRQTISQEFDKAYYLATYPDIAAANVDPLGHFLAHGWREGRNPNRNFDTKYYLAVNLDIAKGGLNPFWHYLVAGRAEGRMPIRPGGYKREIIDQARSLRQRSDAYVVPEPIVQSAEEVAEATAPLLLGGQGFVLSLSHDHYISVTGGTQIFIADEQAAYAKQGVTYVHLSPARPRLTLAVPGNGFLVNVIVDGVAKATVDLQSFTAALAKRRGVAAKCTTLVVHSILGFAVDDVITLAETFKPRSRYFWLHDYASLCGGYNLLRNDVAFCGVPAVDSMACLVCVHGSERAAHLKAMEKLFARCKFDVLAPSAFTLNLWQSRAGKLPAARAIAHPHWKLGQASPVRGRMAREDGVRVAYIGYPTPSKGWPLFNEIVARFGDSPDLVFSHFASPGTPSLPGATFVEARVSADDRLATVQALYKHRIDVVMILSPWPETFSFVAYEAVAAGCQVICLADSGNVAAMVRETGRGVVLEDDDALLAFIEAGGVAELVAKAGPRVRYAIEQIGTTATVATVAAAAAVAKEGKPA